MVKNPLFSACFLDFQIVRQPHVIIVRIELDIGPHWIVVRYPT